MKIDAQGFPLLSYWPHFWNALKLAIRGPQCSALRPHDSVIRPGFTCCTKPRVWHFGGHRDHDGDTRGPWIEPSTPVTGREP